MSFHTPFHPSQHHLPFHPVEAANLLLILLGLLLAVLLGPIHLD